MRIGTIGAGFIARAVATVAIRHGHEVMVSNTRTPDTLFSVTASIGCKAGTPAEAASFGEIALLAIPLKNYHSIPLLPLEGKIVIDANNYYPQRDGRIAELDRNETTTSELLARHLPKSNIVKAFNAIQAADIVDDGRPAGSPKRRAHPIAGNDAAAKEVVTRLLEEFGFDVVDAGALAEGWRFQKDTPAYCVRLDSNELKRALVAAPIALQPQS
jgi:predicted dinucleotide-binding enzyme